MPILSSFFPDQALQGQDLPSHITWKEIEYEQIVISMFRELNLLEIYNVDEENYEIKNNEIIIQKVNSEGYIGAVFSTSILENTPLYGKIVFKFLFKDTVINEIVHNVHLFRPDIEISNIPNEIYIDFHDNTILNKILIKNHGEGTAIIDIDTKDGGGLQKRNPEWLEKFYEEYEESINIEMDKLKIDYFIYEDIIDELKFFMLNTIEFEEEYLEKLNIFIEKLLKIMQQDEEFRYTLSRILVSIIIENPEYMNYYQFVSEYINSIIEEKMLLKDPFNVIDINKEKKHINITIKCIDLLYQKCTQYDIKDVIIFGNDKGEIPLYQLFQLGESK